MIDIFYVNGHAFLHTKSEKLNFLTVEHFPKKNAEAIKESIIDTINTYDARNVIIRHIKADNEFDTQLLHKNYYLLRCTYVKNVHTLEE